MWSWNLGTVQAVRAANEELARYARWEYGPGSGEWLAGELRRAGPSLGGRVRTWLRGLRENGRGAAVRKPTRTAADGGSLLVTEEAGPDPAACGHEEVVVLGSGGNALYRRCAACDVVLVAQGGRLWALLPRTP